MKEKGTLDRREFTLAAALAAPSAPPPAPGGGGAAGDKTGVIGANHGHAGAVITAAELTAPRAITLDIRGTADHPHTVTLTQADVAAIAASTRVTKESSSDAGHSHGVTFN